MKVTSTLPSNLLHLLASATQYRKPSSLPGHVISKIPQIAQKKCLKIEKTKV